MFEGIGELLLRRCSCVVWDLGCFWERGGREGAMEGFGMALWGAVGEGGAERDEWGCKQLVQRRGFHRLGTKFGQPFI